MAIPLVLAKIGTTLLGGLAAGLIDGFEEKAKAKVVAELERHGADSSAATQIVGSVVDAAKMLTGITNPIAATAAVQADPALMEKLQDDTLDTIDRLVPVLVKIEEQGRLNRAQDEIARENARRFNNDNDAIVLDIDFRFIKLRLKFMHLLSIAFVSFCGWFVTKHWATLTPEMRGTVIALMIVAGWNGVRDYWMSSSAGSSMKDTINSELLRRRT